MTPFIRPVNVRTLTRMLKPRPEKALVSPRVHHATFVAGGVGDGGSVVGAGSVAALMNSSGMLGGCRGSETPMSRLGGR